MSERHPVGRLKAQFLRGLGFRGSNPQALVAALQALGREGEVVDRIETPFGIKYDELRPMAGSEILHVRAVA